MEINGNNLHIIDMGVIIMRTRCIMLRAAMGFICVVIIAMIAITTYQRRDMLTLQRGIANELIRFHVRANSDSFEDQELKLLVKTSVVTYIQPLLSESTSLDMSRQILTSHIDDIDEVARQTLANHGSDYDVNVYFEESYFPMKTYGDVTLPPGKYEAFRIDIGKSEGKNWWCVLYPPLCFIDAAHGELPDESKEELRNILTQDEYNAVTDTDYKVQFKYLTFLNELMD